MTLNIRLRQMCLVGRDLHGLATALAKVFDTRPCHGSGDLSRYGLPARGPMSEGGRKLLADKGVENLILPLGTDFVEIVSPFRADSSANRYIERRKGDGGYMAIFQCRDLEAIRARCILQNLRIVWSADFPHYKDIHLHTRDVPGAIVSFAMNHPVNTAHGPWYPAGTAWEDWPQSGPVLGICGAEIQSERPGELARRWAFLMGTPAEATGPDTWRVAIDDGELRFVPASDGRGEGVGGLDLLVRDAAALLLKARTLGLPATGNGIAVAGLRVRLNEAS